MQEKRIRAQQSMKQLSKRMTEQRLRTLEHLRAGMTPGKVRILPRDVEQGLKEFASGVEQLVDRLVRPSPAASIQHPLKSDRCSLDTPYTSHSDTACTLKHCGGYLLSMGTSLCWSKL